MLLTKPPSPNDVIVVKVSNGDEIIAKMVDQSSTHLVISKPMLMILSQDPSTGQPGISMVPFWMVGGERDSNYPINLSHVVCVVKANKEAASSYVSQTSGLTIPRSSGLIT